MLALVLAAVTQAASPPTVPTTAHSAARTASDSAAFDKACTQIRELVHACKWKQVRDRWLAELKLHEDSPYVRASRVTIEDDLRRSMYWLEHPAPDMHTLVSGDVVLFDRTNDTIRIRYDTSVPTQFARTKDPIKDAASQHRPRIPGFEGMQTRTKLPPVFDDFMPEGPFVVHPLEFSGDYSVEIHCGPDAPPPVLIFVLTETDVFAAKLGEPATDAHEAVLPLLSHYAGAKTWTEVDKPKAAANIPREKPYTVFASVAAGRITVSVNGRQALSCTKPRDEFGRFGFTNAAMCTSVVVNGRSFAQWIDALVDETVRKDRTKYDSEWKPDANLPAWLVRRTQPPVNAAEAAAMKRLDTALPMADQKKIQALMNKHKEAECLEAVKALPHEGDALLTCDFLAAVCYAQMGRFEDCATAIAPVCTALPECVTARRVRATAWSQTLPAAEALAERQQIAADFPTEAAAHIDLSRALLHAGRMDDAWSALVAGYANGADTKPLDDQARILDRAIKGPAWRTTNRVITKHYEITSELDKDTCTLVGNVLEEAYGHYQKTIAHPADLAQPMRAYVFATADGLHEYCRDLDLSHANSLLGMFSPDLQQLVVCAQPDHAEFLGTVRHEGFHQYLDQVAPHAPVWLNEGLAQYFEQLRGEKGKLAIDAAHIGRHTALQKRTDWVVYEKLLSTSPADFYDHANVDYDLAWALVMYLMQPESPDRPVAEKLMALITSGKADTTTVVQAFDGVDMPALGEHVKSYVSKLK